MRKLAVVLVMPLAMFAQELVGTFSLDTSIYNDHQTFSITGFSGPFGNSPSAFGALDRLYGLQKKGTNQADVFTIFYIKIGSITIPDPPTGTVNSIIYFSQKFLDDDPGWEFIANYYNNTNGKYSFKVIDETGTVLISDINSATYGFDGQNTYVYADDSYIGYPSTKVWKFRSNISSTSHPLSKTASPGPMMAYMPSGDFRVSLQPVTGGTSIQIFDMLGRQIFRKNIQNIREPTSFIIPSYSMPNSPFVAKVNNTNGSFVKKEIPVR